MRARLCGHFTSSSLPSKLQPCLLPRPHSQLLKRFPWDGDRRGHGITSSFRHAHHLSLCAPMARAPLLFLELFPEFLPVPFLDELRFPNLVTAPSDIHLFLYAVSHFGFSGSTLPLKEYYTDLRLSCIHKSIPRYRCLPYTDVCLCTCYTQANSHTLPQLQQRRWG